MMPQDVCIAFLGFDSDRIYLPVKMLKCHKLHLICRPEPEHENARYNKNLILRALKGIEIVEHQVPNDSLMRINCIKDLIEKEKGHRIFVNVSTGSKLDAVAGMLGIMLFGKDAAIPFYAQPNDTGRFKVNKKGRLQKKILYSETSGVRDLEMVPVLPIQKPDQNMLDGLRILKRANGKIKKRQLVKMMVTEGILEEYAIKKIDGKDRICKTENDDYRLAESSVFHFCENNLFRPLRSKWNAIKEDEKIKNRTVSITEDGLKLVKIFFGE